MTLLSGMVSLFAVADAFEDALGQIHVLEVLEMFEDGFAGHSRFWCAPCAGPVSRDAFQWIAEAVWLA